MPYVSDKQRRYLHAVHPEIAAKWDAEIRAKKKPISKARRDYAPSILTSKPMDDDEMARAKTRQKYFSLTGSGLGLTGLSLLGAGAAMKTKKPEVARKLNNYATNTSITAGGIGALSGINFARIQGEESRRAREIKKSNYGQGYSKYYSDPVEVDSVPVRHQVSDPDWRRKAPYTISPKAADPERSREKRARAYPFLMGAGAATAGGLTVREAMKEKPEKSPKFIDQKILRNKPLRVGAGVAATAALVGGAAYNAKENNRRSYEGQWYPQRERG